MAINIKFDLTGNPEPPTILLANRNGNILGQLDVDVESIDISDKFNDASEFSFTIYKYIDDKLTNLWNKVIDFKLVYCKEWDEWFEIKVELDESTETIKTVFCTQLEKAELSQLNLYNIEINTEVDIEREDYKASILYDRDNTNASTLNRLLKDKAPHYTIAHVDSTIANIQRSFSFDGTSIDDAFQEIAEEIGCVFVYHSYLDEHRILKRTISVYDLQQTCNDCGYRGEFTDVCPKCNGANIKSGYGEDTGIFVDKNELASDGIQLTTDTDSVKNCFKLEAGDDLMTATIRSCNPNGSDYIWYFSDSVKEDMSNELVQKIESYDELYNSRCSNSVSNIDVNLLNKYNALVNKYSNYNKDLKTISTPIQGYAALMNAYYNTIDLSLFLESELMPSVEMSDTNAEEQASLLTASSLSPVAVSDITIASLSTINSAVLAMAKIIVRSTYKVEIKSSELYDSGNKRYWKGNFTVTNYSNDYNDDDEEDTAVSNIISVEVNDDIESFAKQKIDKALNKENTEDYSISGLFEKEYDDFCDELKKYALHPLLSFRDACQVCIDILIEQGVADDESWGDTNEGSEGNLYEKIYKPYYDKLQAIEAEIKNREDEINLIKGVYDVDGNLVVGGLQTNIEEQRNQIQDALDFEKYLGDKLWKEFSAYRRDDKYSNENYISDGLNNAELFERALEFHEVAKNEIYKSAELQHSISTTLNNLLAIPKFKKLVKSFKLGNWIRVRIDDEIYKLRLLQYDISFDDFDNIPVEFSDVIRIKNSVTDVNDILAQASSMATSYGLVQRQAKQGNDAQDIVNQWTSEGLNSAIVQIQNNNNEEITFTKNGLLGRSYDDITDTYSPEQFKLTHNIMAYTTDNWKTVSAALGKHEYEYYNSSKVLQKDIGYGLSAKFLNAGYISGSQMIGGEIYSENYTSTAGTYLNLNNGTFSWAGGKIKYDGTDLKLSGVNLVWGDIEGAEEEVAEIAKDTIDVDYINALKIKAGSVDAENISGTTITGKTISGGKVSGATITGGSLNIGDGNFVVDSDGKMTAKSGTFSGSLSAAKGTFAGTLSAVSGSFTSLTAGKSIFKTNQVIIDASYVDSEGKEISQGSIYIGRSGVDGWEDITIRPSGDNLGNIGTSGNSWDLLYVKNGAIQSSDRNRKTDISSMNEKQERLFNLLTPVTFKFIDSTYDRYHYGFISQDVESAIIESGMTTKDFAGFCKDIKLDKNGLPMLDENGNQIYTYSLRYNEFIALNTHMIQKLQAENCELQKRIALLEEKIGQL